MFSARCKPMCSIKSERTLQHSCIWLTDVAGGALLLQFVYISPTCSSVAPCSQSMAVIVVATLC